MCSVFYNFLDSLDISESDSDSDQSEHCSQSDGNSNSEEVNPNEQTVNPEEINGKPEEDENKEEDKNIQFITWFTLLLLRIKLHYNLSNNLFTVLLNVICYIFLIFRHPLRMMFPNTISDIEIILNFKVLNKTIIFAVCPNPKCSALYHLNEISVNRSGQQKPAQCKNKIWGKKCNTELAFEKKLSFGRTKMVPFKTFPFLPPSEWIKTFF